MEPLFKILPKPRYGTDPETGRLNIHPDFWKDPDGRPTMGAATPDWAKPDARRAASLPEWAVSKLPTGASRDSARIVAHGLARTGNTILKFLDIPNRVFGNTRSVLQDIYERSEANLARDAYEDRSGVPQVAETAVHLASAGVLGRALPAVFGANVGADTYETAKYAGESEGSALAKGALHGAVDTAIWTLGQGLASKYLPKAWQWFGRELTGAMRGAASSVTSDAMLNSMGAGISGEEMAKRAVHAAWMVPLLGMLKMGKGSRERALAELKKVRPDLAGERVDKVIETLENEFSDPRSQKVALAWVARKGANLPDDLAQIHQAIEVANKVKGVDFTQKSPFEIISDPRYARYLPKPKPQDVKAFSNMKRYPMGVIGFDVSDDAAGRQATREMINAYMSPSSNPWCLATGSGAAKLGELGPGAEGYWKGHSAVPKQIFFQEVDGKLELTAFRATSSGGEGRQEYWDTSDAGYSGIPLKVKVPGDPMGRYRKMVFRPKGTTQVYRSETELERGAERGDFPAERLEQYRAIMLRNAENVGDFRLELRGEGVGDKGEVQGTFEDIAPGKVFKGDPFRDGRSQTWVRPRASQIDGIILGELTRHGLPRTIEGLRELRRGWTQPGSSADSGMLDVLDDNIAKMGQSGEPSWVLVEDKERTTENGITKFRTTKYADPTDRDYEPPKPGEAPKPVEIEESELVSPEWMRARGYDPESESDVRRMQSDLNIQAWGNGVEAAMAVVPTKRTTMDGAGNPQTSFTYGPDGRKIRSVDRYFRNADGSFDRDRTEFFESGPNGASVPREILEQSDLPFPVVSYDMLDRMGNGARVIHFSREGVPEVTTEVKWDEGLGGFVRTSGNRRWRTDQSTDGPALYDRVTNLGLQLDAYHMGDQPIPDGLLRDYAEASSAWDGWVDRHPNYYPENFEGDSILGQGRPSRYYNQDPGTIVEDLQPDGTWAPAMDVLPDGTRLPPPPPAVRQADTLIEHQRMMDEFDRNGGYIPQGLLMDPDDVPLFALKAGRTRRDVKAAAKAGDADRFALSRNFLATDEVPETLFGIPIAADEGSWTDRDIAFFRKHPEAGGYYDMGDEEGAPEEPPMQAASKAGDASEKAVLSKTRSESEAVQALYEGVTPSAVEAMRARTIRARGGDPDKVTLGEITTTGVPVVRDGSDPEPYGSYKVEYRPDGRRAVAMSARGVAKIADRTAQREELTHLLDPGGAEPAPQGWTRKPGEPLGDLYQRRAQSVNGDTVDREANYYVYGRRSEREMAMSMLKQAIGRNFAAVGGDPVERTSGTAILGMLSDYADHRLAPGDDLPFIEEAKGDGYSFHRLKADDKASLPGKKVLQEYIKLYEKTKDGEPLNEVEREAWEQLSNPDAWDRVVSVDRFGKAVRAAEGGGTAAETFDTPIPKELQAKYDAWYAQLPKNLQYTGDYDLQGTWLERLGQPDKYEASQNGHLDDYGKKPNHITFSTGSKWHDPKVPERTGGEWRRAEDGSWDFYPGTGNKASDDELKAYFDKYERGNRVHKRETREANGAGKAKRKVPPIVKGPIHYGPPPPPSRGKYPGIANNPGNVEKHERRSDKTLFKGEIGDGVRPKRFANFSDPVDGLVAAAIVIRRRADELSKSGKAFTIGNYAPIYNPPTENDTAKYVRDLSRYSGIPADRVMDPRDTNQMVSLLKNVVRFESGVPNSEWFTDEEYRRAARAMNRGPESAPSLPASTNRQASGGSTQTYKE